MATVVPPSSSESKASECLPCCSEKTLAYLVMRLLLGTMLLLALDSEEEGGTTVAMVWVRNGKKAGF